MFTPLLAVPLFGMGMQEWLIIGAVVALLFGARKLPQLGKGLGEGIRNFRKGLKTGPEDDVDKLESGTEDKQLKNGEDDETK